MATNRLIHVVATRRKHLLLGMDIPSSFSPSSAGRAGVGCSASHVELRESCSWKRFSQVVENETCSAWTHEGTSKNGLNCPATFSKSRLGRCEANVHLICSTGQGVTEWHMGDMRASGPCDTLDKLEGGSSERTSVKHAILFRAGESETLEHLRRERILPPQVCFVRPDSMRGVLRHCCAWRRANLSPHSSLQPATEMFW